MFLSRTLGSSSANPMKQEKQYESHCKITHLPEKTRQQVPSLFDFFAVQVWMQRPIGMRLLSPFDQQKGPVLLEKHLAAKHRVQKWLPMLALVASKSFRELHCYWHCHEEKLERVLLWLVLALQIQQAQYYSCRPANDYWSSEANMQGTASNFLICILKRMRSDIYHIWCLSGRVISVLKLETWESLSCLLAFFFGSTSDKCQVAQGPKVLSVCRLIAVILSLDTKFESSSESLATKDYECFVTVDAKHFEWAPGIVDLKTPSWRLLADDLLEVFWKLLTERENEQNLGPVWGSWMPVICIQAPPLKLR